MNKSNFLVPTYLENVVTYDNEDYFTKMEMDIEWRGQIKSSSNNTKFRIKYYGELMEEYGLITADDFSEALVVAEDIETNEQIVLFDGCKHGYNAMFCDEYSDEQIKNRPLENVFKDDNGNEIFEVIVQVYHGIDYDDEIEDYYNDNNEIELLSGEIISKDELKRNGFDFLGIQVINQNGKQISIVEEELA